MVNGFPLFDKAFCTYSMTHRANLQKTLLYLALGYRQIEIRANSVIPFINGADKADCVIEYGKREIRANCAVLFPLIGKSIQTKLHETL